MPVVDPAAGDTASFGPTAAPAAEVLGRPGAQHESMESVFKRLHAGRFQRL
jgi:hypothetical protein